VGINNYNPLSLPLSTQRGVKMEQQKIWKDKDVRIARQSAIKAGIGILDIAERLGLLDVNIESMDALLDAHDKLVEKIYNKIYEGLIE
jgi:uncharacterized protein YjgD (DUF1641 family)